MRRYIFALFLGWTAVAHGQISGSSTQWIDQFPSIQVLPSDEKLSKMQQSVRVESVLSPTYIALGVQSEELAPTLSRAQVGASISELKSQNPYKKKDEAEVRRTVQMAYPTAPEAVQVKLINIFMDADQRLFEMHENKQSMQGDRQEVLIYEYPGIQVVNRIYAFEVKSRLASSNELPKLVDDFDEELGTIMIRGRGP